MYNTEKNPYTASNDGFTDQDVPICKKNHKTRQLNWPTR